MRCIHLALLITCLSWGQDVPTLAASRDVASAHTDEKLQQHTATVFSAVCEKVVPGRLASEPDPSEYPLQGLVNRALGATGTFRLLIECQCCESSVPPTGLTPNCDVVCTSLSGAIERLAHRIDSDRALAVNGLLSGIAPIDGWNTVTFPSLAPTSLASARSRAAPGRPRTPAAAAVGPLLGDRARAVVTAIDAAGLPDWASLDYVLAKRGDAQDAQRDVLLSPTKPASMGDSKTGAAADPACTGGTPYAALLPAPLLPSLPPASFVGAGLAALRHEAVRRSVYHAYAGYERGAWGRDVLRPLSGTGAQHLCKSGETLVDSLDTLLLAALPGQFAAAQAWVQANLTVPRLIVEGQDSEEEEEEGADRAAQRRRPPVLAAAAGSSSEATATAAATAATDEAPQGAVEEATPTPAAPPSPVPSSPPPPLISSAWTDVNLFESTIRLVGGLLAAHELADAGAEEAPTAASGAAGDGDGAGAATGAAPPPPPGLFLERAEAAMAAFVATGAFATSTGLPYGTLTVWPRDAGETAGWTPASRAAAAAAATASLAGPGVVGPGGTAHNPAWIRGFSSLSEVGTLSLELLTLARLTRNLTYARLSHRISRFLVNAQPPDGLYPIYVDPQSGHYMNAQVTLGARGDSTYEYLLKTWLLLRGDDWAEERAMARAAAALGLQLALDARLATAAAAAAAEEREEQEEEAKEGDLAGASSAAAMVHAASAAAAGPAAAASPSDSVDGTSPALAAGSSEGSRREAPAATTVTVSPPPATPLPRPAEPSFSLRPPALLPRGASGHAQPQPAPPLSSLWSALWGGSGGGAADIPDVPGPALRAFVRRVDRVASAAESFDDGVHFSSSSNQGPAPPPTQAVAAASIRAGLPVRALLRSYNAAVCGVMDRLLQVSSPGGFYFVAEAAQSSLADATADPALIPKMDHLVCFLPGLLALGVRHGAGHEAMADRAVAAIRRRAASEAVAAFLAWARPLLRENATAQDCCCGNDTEEAQQQPSLLPRDDLVMPGLRVSVAASAVQPRPVSQCRRRRRRRRPHVSGEAVKDEVTAAPPAEVHDADTSAPPAVPVEAVPSEGTAPHEGPADPASAGAPFLCPCTTLLGRALGAAAVDPSCTDSPQAGHPCADEPTAAALAAAAAAAASESAALAAEVLSAMDPFLSLAEAVLHERAGLRAAPQRFRRRGSDAAAGGGSEVHRSPTHSRASPADAARGRAGSSSSSGSGLAPDLPLSPGHEHHNASASDPPPQRWWHPVFAHGGGVGVTGGFCAMADAANASATLLRVAHELTRTCAALSQRTATGLAPEIVTFAPGADFAPNADALHSLLRPEAAESLYLLHRLSGAPPGSPYARWGWRLFSAFEAHARVAGGGYASVENASAVPARGSGGGRGSLGRSNMQGRQRGGHMESFFLAETLKYLLLLTGDAAASSASTAASPEAEPAAPAARTSASGSAASEEEDEAAAWEQLMPPPHLDASGAAATAPWLFDVAASAWAPQVVPVGGSAPGDAAASVAAPLAGSTLGDSRVAPAAAAAQLLPLDDWVLNTEAHPLRRWPRSRLGGRS